MSPSSQQQIRIGNSSMCLRIIRSCFGGQLEEPQRPGERIRCPPVPAIAPLQVEFTRLLGDAMHPRHTLSFMVGFNLIAFRQTLDTCNEAISSARYIFNEA